MAKLVIAEVLRSGALSGGHVIALDLKLTSGDTVTIECGQENLPFLSAAINTAGVVAERARKAQPGTEIST